MNDFVNYLNSIHNIGGDSTGSLAEKQVTSPYFDMIKVDRKIGDHIANCVATGEHKAFIITGHAGDGKTSILFQVLKALNRLSENTELNTIYEFSDFYCVKDMSEISEKDQIEILRKTLDSPLDNKTSLLISNTGPLLRAFLQLIEKRRIENSTQLSDCEMLEIQSKLLLQLDQNNDEPLSIDDYTFTLINIARVDNVPFSVRILRKIIDEKLWTKCVACINKDVCPIKNNQEIVMMQIDRVSAFIESYYRFLYENDKRMTIRQLVGHISFALTGNLSCETIASKPLKDPIFNYNFANLFFGYWGLTEKKECLQIKGIERIRSLNIEGIALDVDYDLFVKHDYSCFLPTIQNLITNLQKKYRKLYKIYDEETMLLKSSNKIDNELRNSIRRFYLMYSQYSGESNIYTVINQVFGLNFSDYQKLVTEKQNKAMLRNFKELVFRALYIKNTGFLPDNENNLPLTLRREDSVFQNVMLVLGKVNMNDIEIIQEPQLSSYEDFHGKQQVFIRFNDKSFPLSLPMVTYFNELISGAIASNINPSLTHGIATLDAMLIEQYGDDLPESKDDCELTVLINTIHGQELKRFAFDGDSLSIL